MRVWFLPLAVLGLLVPMQSAAADQPQLHMRSAGSGKRCWVLVHPFGASGRFWEKRAPGLAERHRVRIYYPDLPSHGLSPMTTDFNYEMATDALQAALRDICPKPAVVIGGSSGGIIGMKLATRSHARAIGVGVGWSFNDADVKDLVDSGEHPSAGFRDYLVHFAEQGPAQVDLMLKFAKGLAAIGTGPLFNDKEARALRGRLLVIHGDADDFFFNPSTAKLVQMIPGT